jgi:outer membrane lipoprotein-sorting protein
MKKFITIFSLFCVFVLISLSRRAFAEVSFLKIISGANEKFQLIETMSATLIRISKRNNTTVEESWNYYYKKPDKIRIEYLKPHLRQLALNSDNLVEYIPEIKKAMVFNLNDLDAKEKSEIIQNAFSRVSIPGLRPGEVKEGNVNIKRVKLDEFDAYFVDNKDPDYQIWVDEKSGALLKHVIFNKKGEVIYLTYGTDFKSFKGDILIPQKIKLVLPDEKEDGKMVTSEVTLNNLKVNEGIKDDLFNIELDNDVEILK